MVTQEIHVFAGTVRGPEGRRARCEPRSAERRCEMVGGWDRVRALPQGLDTVVGDGAPTLTAALAQRWRWPGSVLADPLAAVLDEATAEAAPRARGPRTGRAAATAGRTSMTIAHRLTQARSRTGSS